MFMEDEIRATTSENMDYSERIRKLKTINHQNNFLYTIDDYSLDNVISIVKQKNKKGLKEILLIQRFLENTELYKKIKSSNYEDHLPHKILSHCAHSCSYKNLKKDSIIYRFGEKADKIYILMKGKIKLYKPVKTELVLTPEEYFLKIADIQKEYPELAKIIIEINSSVFPIESNHISVLREIIFFYKLNEIIKEKNFPKIRDLFNDYSFDPEEFGLNMYDLYIGSDLNMVIRNLSYKLFAGVNIVLKNYSFVEDIKEKDVVLIQYEEELLIENAGEYFGNETNNEGLRLSLCKSYEDSDLLIISSDFCKDVLEKEKKKIRIKEIYFLTANFFFKSVKVPYFELCFFQYFSVYNYRSGDTLFSEGKKSGNLYFIKDGKIELTITQNYNGLQNLINTFSNLEGNDRLIEADTARSNNSNNDMKSAENSKIKTFKLFLFESKEVLGCEETFYKIPHFFTAKVVSQNASIYQISKDDFLQITQKESVIWENFGTLSISKMNNIFLRLLDLKKSIIKKKEDKSIKLNSQNSLSHKNSKIIIKNFEFNKDYFGMMKTNTLTDNSLGNDIIYLDDNIKIKDSDLLVNSNSGLSPRENSVIKLSKFKPSFNNCIENNTQTKINKFAISKFSVEDLVLKKMKESSKDLISGKLSRTSINKIDENNVNWNVLSMNVYEKKQQEDLDKIDKRVIKRVLLKPLKSEKKRYKERETLICEKKENKMCHSLKESYITLNSPSNIENMKRAPFPRVLFIKTNKNLKK